MNLVMRKSCALLLLATWLAACRQPSRMTRPTLDAGSSLAVDPNTRLDALERANLDAELAFGPTTATFLGVHSYDDRLDDVRADAGAAEITRLRALLESLALLDEARLDAAHRLDLLLLEHRVEHALFEMTELKPLEKSPLRYLELASQGVYQLLDGPPAALAERLRLLDGRLRRIRPLLEEGRRALRNPPELSTRKAIELGQAMRQFVAETLPKLAQAVGDGKLLEEHRVAAADAGRALDDFLTFMQRDLLARSRGDFALGRERLVEKLRLVEAIEVTPEQLLQMGERELKEARRLYDEQARVLLGQAAARSPGSPRSPSDAARLLEDDRLKPEELLAETERQLDAMVAFLRGAGLVPLPEPPRPRVQEMPPQLWGYVQLSAAGVLEPKPLRPVLYVDPVDKSWPERRKLEHLRTFNRPVLILTLLHEVLPGHFVQGEQARSAPTPMQKIAGSGGLVEGWAEYAARMMLEQGFLPTDARLRLGLERGRLLRSARMVAAIRLHAFGAKLDDVIKLFTDDAYLDDYGARREAERAALDPLIFLPTLGRLEIEKLRDDLKRSRGSDFSLGAFHAALLGHGTTPVAVLRQLLGADAHLSPL